MPTESKNYTVNAGEYEILGMKVVEKLPPNSPFASMMGKAGAQTTPPLGRGNLEGSVIALLNGNLEHACDFKFMINVDAFSLFGVNNPAEAIQRALRNAKLKATNRLRMLLKEAVKYIREGIKMVMKTLGFDPSGELSLSFQIGKDLVDQINTAVQFVAEKVEEVMEWVYFAQQIEQLILWIGTLPARIKQLLAACLTNFKNSIKQVANQLQTLPEQIINANKAQIQALAGQFAQAAQEVANAATSALTEHSSTMPDALYQALMDPSADTAAALQDHIDSTTPSAEEINQTATDNQTAVSSKGP